jgi:hypothetical protein
MRPRPGTVVAGMAELIMPSVTPCVAAMCSPISSAPAAMPAAPDFQGSGGRIGSAAHVRSCVT